MLSCTITTDDRDLPTLEIPDAKCECHDYLISRADLPRRVVWSVWLTRIDGEGKSPYRVSLNDRGGWHCTCDDFRYRGHKRPCKHLNNTRPVYTLLRRLTTNGSDGS